MSKDAETRKRPIFRKEDRHELRYQLSIAIAATLSWLFFIVPSPLRNWFAARCGLLFYRFTHTYRDNVKANVGQVLGKSMDDPLVEDLTRGIFRYSALNFMDLMVLPRRSSRHMRAQTHVVEGDWSVVREARAKGKGVIFVSAHLGCFDFMGQSFSAHGLPLIVVTGRTTSRFIFDGVTWLRGSRGGTFVEPTPSGVRNVIRALRRNEVAVFVADRDFFQNGVDVTFFDRHTTLPPGPIRIARDTGAVVIPMFSRRGRHGHELRIFPPFEVEKTRDVDEDVRRGMQRLVPDLERGIRESVDQWVMFQRVWPERPVEPVKIFPTGSPLESELLESELLEKVASRLPEIRTGDGGA